MECSPPGSSVHEILQSRTLQWIATSFMDCSPPGSSVCGISQTRILEWFAISFSSGSFRPRIEPGSPALQADSLPTELRGKPTVVPCWLSIENIVVISWVLRRLSSLKDFHLEFPWCWGNTSSLITIISASEIRELNRFFAYVHLFRNNLFFDRIIEDPQLIFYPAFGPNSVHRKHSHTFISATPEKAAMYPCNHFLLIHPTGVGQCLSSLLCSLGRS